MGKRADAILTVTLVIAALGVSGSYAYRTVFPAVRQVDAGAETKMRSWDRALAMGHRVAGDSTSPATMLIFTDFQCPACRGFHATTVKGLIEKYPKDLRVIYLQFPLSYHAQALPAARAGECAARLGDYRKWVDLVYQKQDSLGLKSYGSFANDIGVLDTARVSACASDTSRVAELDAQAKLGEELPIRGTPTVVLDGWILQQPPSTRRVDSVVASARIRRSARP